MNPLRYATTVLLFASFVFFLVASVSSPVIPALSYVKITLPRDKATVSLGTFGRCLTRKSKTSCSPKAYSYNISEVVADTIKTTYSSQEIDRGTAFMVLVPVTSGISFPAFCTAALSHRIGTLPSLFLASLVWLVSLVATGAVLFVFVNLKRSVDFDGNGSTAEYQACFWLAIVGFLTLLLAVGSAARDFTTSKVKAKPPPKEEKAEAAEKGGDH